MFYQKDKKLIFCFGFAKNVKEDLDNDDKKLLNKLSEIFLQFSDGDLLKNIQRGELIEIKED